MTTFLLSFYFCTIYIYFFSIVVSIRKPTGEWNHTPSINIHQSFVFLLPLFFFFLLLSQLDVPFCRNHNLSMTPSTPTCIFYFYYWIFFPFLLDNFSSRKLLFPPTSLLKRKLELIWFLNFTHPTSGNNKEGFYFCLFFFHGTMVDLGIKKKNYQQRKKMPWNSETIKFIIVKIKTIKYCFVNTETHSWNISIWLCLITWFIIFPIDCVFINKKKKKEVIYSTIVKFINSFFSFLYFFNSIDNNY